MERPRVFIGSSKESLRVAEAFADGIVHFAEHVLWSEGVFEPGQYNLPSLIGIARSIKYAVIVLNHDDLVNSRNQESWAPRDNVIFELGLFMGIISPTNVFFLVPIDRRNLKIPSDLMGITPLEYDSNRSDNNMESATGVAVRQLRRILGARSTQPYVTTQDSGYTNFTEGNNDGNLKVNSAVVDEYIRLVTSPNADISGLNNVSFLLKQAHYYNLTASQLIEALVRLRIDSEMRTSIIMSYTSKRD
ncbi:hypothetical protein DAETH_14870 [Deinococcus aetherius]|uniref:CD-NTase-associated protein 12/Pycsar effector protein TIR domain-containing protein n=1 Tax=Deinococcus aetherius TaxID=200252 RepID=A0ABN6RDR0_9DEIO|nr:nucleotide-binding protein [Deinococcus aetherius]BDP41518.1 hypothetical protein DAETH_14870 [Deinococcus aetherius]